MFERYRKNYEHLSYSDLSDLYCLDVEENYKERKDEVVQLIKKILGDKKFAYRGDYTSFLKVSYVLLTGDTSKF